QLLWVVPYIICKDGMASPTNAISSGHLDPTYTSLPERLSNMCQTDMKQICHNTAPRGLVGDL
ncbi:hypothetical protein L208DRAFT_1098302, partial [Tricholoma matsutake]